MSVCIRIAADAPGFGSDRHVSTMKYAHPPTELALREWFAKETERTIKALRARGELAVGPFAEAPTRLEDIP